MDVAGADVGWVEPGALVDILVNSAFEICEPETSAIAKMEEVVQKARRI